jgi:cytochrome c oxidase subunit 1
MTTLWNGNIRVTPALLFLFGSVSVLVLGGFAGIFPGGSTLDIHLHDTYFVVAYSHLVMGVTGLFGMFAAIYHWFPRMFGRLMNNTLAHIHTWVTIIVTLLIFWRMNYEGLAGMPRRYSDYENWFFINLFNDSSNLISAAAIVVFATQLLFIVNFGYSIFRGPRSSPQKT